MIGRLAGLGAWLSFLFLASPAASHATILPDAELRQIFLERASQAEVNPLLAMAISKIESNYHPWALNIAGKSYKPQNRSEALVLIQIAQKAGRSYDIGLMQINNWWLRRLRLSPEQVLEPRNNILVGSMILRHEIKKYGLSLKAIGAYHTPPDRNPNQARTYARNVLSHLKKIVRLLNGSAKERGL